MRACWAAEQSGSRSEGRNTFEKWDASVLGSGAVVMVVMVGNV